MGKADRIVRKVLVFFIMAMPSLLLIPVILHFSDQTLSLFPLKKGDVHDRVSLLRDTMAGGESSIESFSFDSEQLRIAYIHKKQEGPTADIGITFYPEKEKSSMDLSGYDYVTLSVKEATAQCVAFLITKERPDVPENRPGEQPVHTRYIKEMRVSPSLKDYKINMSEFMPETVFSEPSRPAAGNTSYKKVVSFDLQFIRTHEWLREDETESIIIEEISFHRKNGVWIAFFTGGVVLIYSLLVLLVVGKRKKKKISLPQYRHLTFINYRDTDVHRIKEYIKDNFYDPDISTIKMQEKLGVPSFRIFNLVREEYGHSFKQLINRIRIEEAKRLLEESDLRVIDISYKVGFNDSSYFNKVFKRISGISPTEHRIRKN